MVYTGDVTTAKIFPNGRSQAVRLPKEFRFEEDEVFITRMGTAIVLLPKVGGWNVLFEAIDGFSDDFMADRAQASEHQDRDLDL